MKPFYRSMVAVVPGLLMLWAMPAWAGHGHHFGNRHETRAKHLSKSTQSGTGPVLTIDSVGTADADSDSSHASSNEGGALRGLERANDVAGEHGEAGRTNAAHHGHH